MSKRAANLEHSTAQDKAYVRLAWAESFLIAEGELCPVCRDLGCDYHLTEAQICANKVRHENMDAVQ